LGNGETIPTDCLIWTSGVTGVEVVGLPKEAITRGRRIMVDEYNKVNFTENIYAVGDICYQTSDKDYPAGHPQLAQVAIQQASLLGDNLKNMVGNKPLKPFKYNNKGSMAIIA